MKIVFVALGVLLSCCIAFGYTLPGHDVQGSINMNGNNIYGIGSPGNLTDVATKGYVQGYNTGDNLTTEDLETKINKTDIGTYISGTSGYIPKFTGTNVIVDSVINESSYCIGINTLPRHALSIKSPSYSNTLEIGPHGTYMDLYSADWSRSVYIPIRIISALGINKTATLPLDVSGAIGTDSYLLMAGIGTPSAPPSNALKLYSKLGQLWYVNGTGDYYVGGGTAAGGGGDFYGVASSVTDDLVSFADTGGKTAKDSGKKLSDLVLKDGSTTMTGSLPFGTYKATGLGNGTASQDSMTVSQGNTKLAKIGVTVGPASDDVSYDYETDGSADDVQLNAALDFQDAHGGGVVYLVPGKDYKIAADVTVHSGCSLVCGGFAPHGYDTGDAYRGTARINITSSYKTIGIIVEEDTKVEGLEFWYPNQNMNSAPDEYYASIRSTGSIVNSEIAWCNFKNSYIGVDIVGTWDGESGTSHGRVNVHDNVGYPLYRGIRMGYAGDSDRVYNNHWIAGSFAGSTLQDWVEDNAVAIELTNEHDNSFFVTNFAYRYRYGLKFDGSDGQHGSCWGLNVIGNSFDTCPIACSMISVSDSVFADNHFIGIDIAGTLGSNSFTDCDELRLSGNRFVGSDNTFTRCDHLNMANDHYSGTSHSLNIVDCSYVEGSTLDLKGDGTNTWNGLYVDGSSDRFAFTNLCITGTKSGSYGWNIASGANYFNLDNILTDRAGVNSAGTGSTKVIGTEIIG